MQLKDKQSSAIDGLAKLEKQDTMKDKQIRCYWTSDVPYPTSIVSDAHRVISKQDNVYLWRKSCLCFINCIIKYFINLEEPRVKVSLSHDFSLIILLIIQRKIKKNSTLKRNNYKNNIQKLKIPSDANHEGLCFQYTSRVFFLQDPNPPKPMLRSHCNV